MRPSKRLLLAWLIWGISALGLGLARFWLAEGFLQVLTPIVHYSGALLLILCCVDFFSRKALTDITVSRELPASFSLAAANKVNLKVRNHGRFRCHLQITDHFPSQTRCTDLPANLSLAAGEDASVIYKVYPVQRGNAEFGQVQLRINSLLGLWQFQTLSAEAQQVRIYPNFASIVSFETLGQGQQIGQLGIHVMQRRGEGLDFHQLREFRVGDSLRQVDWRATSRLRKPISREYQEERDQDIIFLLDCGRRMRSQDGDLSHFDHTLNALLLTSYVALRQGDAVGLMTFAGDPRYVSPIKGKENLNLLLNQVYDLHSTTQTSDYLKAAEELIARFRKRSLIVIITNLREEDEEDLSAAIQLLKKYHLVMVASLRENLIQDTIDQPVKHFNEALLYCSAVDWLQNRRRVLERVRRSGAVLADSEPETMQIALVNEYLALKRSGRF